MANLLDINKSAYINNNIEIYAQNKIGQYSKFLNKNPIYLTYYSINLQETTADVGIGSVESEIGINSPVRFNKILEFPVYNLPTINPDITFDESGYDVELDLSGITILPNTIKPMVSDYIIFKIPGVDKELLFRVNNVKYNTIQSNDFYLVDIDIKDIGTDLEATMVNQITQTYQTIFDNIGTQDKCFLLLEDVDKALGIVKLYTELKTLYKNIFYNKECDSFVLYNNTLYPDIWLCDSFIGKFINDSNIYYEPNSTNSLFLTTNNTVPIDFEHQLNKTLLGSVLKRSIDFLHTYTYYYQTLITKPFSPFVINNYECNNLNLLFYNTKLDENEVTDYANGYIADFYSVDLIEQIKSGTLISDDYLDITIFNYLTGNTVTVDKDTLLSYGFDNNIKTYMYLPIILYIIRQYYNDYFKNS
jgi:hypothetical protein